eukprot:7254613-Lingulodinium_polyedra.AAC.1
MLQQFVVMSAGVNWMFIVVAIGGSGIRIRVGGRGLRHDRDDRLHTRTVTGAVVMTFLDSSAGERGLGVVE